MPRFAAVFFLSDPRIAEFGSAGAALLLGLVLMLSDPRGGHTEIVAYQRLTQHVPGGVWGVLFACAGGFQMWAATQDNHDGWATRWRRYCAGTLACLWAILLAFFVAADWQVPSVPFCIIALAGCGWIWARLGVRPPLWKPPRSSP